MSLPLAFSSSGGGSSTIRRNFPHFLQNSSRGSCSMLHCGQMTIRAPWFFNKMLQNTPPSLPVGNVRQVAEELRFSQILRGLQMHFMCHETNKFLSSDFKAFSHHSIKQGEQFSECGQILAVLLSTFYVPRLGIEFKLTGHAYAEWI